MDTDERAFLLILSSVAIKTSRFPSERVFQHFSSAKALFNASEKELLDIEGMLPSTAKMILSFRGHGARREELRKIDREGYTLVPYYSEDYPENLRTIKDAPPVLYVHGRIEKTDVQALAVIGSRKATAYGIDVCQALTKALVLRGFRIVSGMASGIDAMAHWSAIESEGRTIGVLGTGLDIVYPASNAPLYKRVPEKGALVSEFPMGTQGYPSNFPRRNRLISGLSMGVLVVEASERSGTMTTVRMALEQGREVFAVPGDIRSDKSRGTHRLIKQGAKLVDQVEDIVEELSLAVSPSQGVHTRDLPGDEPAPLPFADDTRGGSKAATELDIERNQTLSEEAVSVVQVIGTEPTLLDYIIARCGMSPAKVAGLLTELEILGMVRPVGGNRFRRIR